MTPGIIRILTALLLCCAWSHSNAQEPSRWRLLNDGNIQWTLKPGDSHRDHVEMSGFLVSAIVHYGVQDGLLVQKVQLVFPMLRTIPNDTHASLAFELKQEELPQLTVDGKPVEERPASFSFNGMLACIARTNAGIDISRQWFPSTDQAAFIEQVNIRNTSANRVEIVLPDLLREDSTDASKGVSGAYVLRRESDKKGAFSLAPGETLDYAVIFSGREAKNGAGYIAAGYELKKRQNLLDNTFGNLVFECPDEVLNRAFAFAKLRAVESIYHTKGGLMHGPGGGRYYAAIWANDQAEYANPFFPYLGNLAGNESAVNSFRHFARYINPEYKPIPSSIVAEGLDYWNGAGDRGDMAMIAYGAARFALAYGDKKTAQELWPLIEWCLEYCNRKRNAEGVVASDCDELENRFPAGEANLNTSALYYDALNSAAKLGKELGKNQAQLDRYTAQALALRSAIERYFGAQMDGFDTYRYYKGNTLLRAWICTPLTVGIYDRSKGTIDALFSDKLWTRDGLASESGSTTFWDRATLYALRGVFAAGETKRAMEFLQYYANRRLLGEHVPYAVEAYPEGNQRHLSAESALFCRVITEGLWGIRPEGLHAFSLTPQLPENWNGMSLKKIKAFDRDFDMEIKRAKNKLQLRVFDRNKVYFSQTIGNGETVRIEL